MDVVLLLVQVFKFGVVLFHEVADADALDCTLSMDELGGLVQASLVLLGEIFQVVFFYLLNSSVTAWREKAVGRPLCSSGHAAVGH